MVSQRVVSNSILGAVLCGIIFTSPQAYAGAPQWVVDHASSKIEFSGTQSGDPFSGQIKNFETTIIFDAAHLDQSHVQASFEMASAQTGDKMIDGSLSSNEWLNPEAFPKAIFETVSFEDKGSDKDGIESYVAQGHLTILGVSKDVTLPFTLKNDGAHATMDGQLTLNRLDYGIGKESDGKAEWVSDPISVKIHIEATHTP